jgi:hypothetical protein
LLDAFDLLRGHNINDRAATLLDPTAHSNWTPLQPLRIDARRGEFSPMTLKNRYRKIAPHRRPKFKYIVAPLSRTDNTLPSTSANWPARLQPLEMFRPQRGEIGVCPDTAPGTRNPF